MTVTFSEAMGSGATTASNYTLSGTGKGTLAAHPSTVALDSGSTYLLTWATGEMLNGGDITVTVANAADVAGNSIGSPNSATDTGHAQGTPPDAPTGLSLQSPVTTPNNDTTPTIRISGVVSGDAVALFTANDCSIGSLVASGTASGTTIDLTSSTLTENSYTFYADSTDPAGNVSACSSTGPASVAYVLDTTAPTVAVSSVRQSTADSASADFASGSAVGVAYSGGKLGLGSGGGCDGTSTNCAELDSSWTPQWASLAGYWKLNESSGTSSIADSSPNSNAGTVNGGVILGGAGKLRAAATFDGSTGYVDLGTPASLKFATSLTISAWVNPTSTSGLQTILSDRPDGGAASYSFRLWAAAIEFYNGGFWEYISPNGIIQANQWNYVAVTYDGSTVTMYLNGVQVYSHASSGTPGVGSGNVEIGAYGSAHEAFAGQIDDVAIWSTPLTGPEIQTIYSRQSAKYTGSLASRVMDAGSSKTWAGLSWLSSLPFGKELPDEGYSESSTDYSSISNNLMTGIQGLWHLNESAGTSAAASVIDSSGNHYDGTPNNGVTFGATGVLRQAASLDGNDDWIGFPIVASPVDYTISAWVYLNSTSPMSILYRYDGGGGFSHQLRVGSSGKFEHYTYDGNLVTLVGTTSVAIGQWYHVVGVGTGGGTIQLYVNGVSEGTPPAVGTFWTGGNQYVVGKSSGGGAYGQLNGLVDEVAIWHRALSSAEVLQLYRRGANRIKFQVRSCTSSDCSDRSPSGDWLGPDGTNQTYFSELNNNTAPLAQTGFVNSSYADLTLSDFTNPPSASRYFQYKAILEGDDADSSLGPALKRVQVKAASNATAPIYQIKGTCSENGRTVSISVTDGTHTATGSATCASGAYTANIDISGFNDATITTTASQTDEAGNTTTTSGTTSSANANFPAAATGLAWSEGSSTPQGSPLSTTIHATWTVSASSDVQNQRVQLYTGSCAATSGPAASVGSATANSFALTVSNLGTYSFKLITQDSAGNLSTSACSATITVTPVLADNSNAALGFAGGSNSGTAWSTSKLALSTTTNGAELDATWAPQWSHLKGYWKLDEGSSATTAADSTSNANNGTVHGGVTLGSSGKLGTAGVFDGVDGYVSIPHQSNLDAPTGWTISAWVNQTASTSCTGIFTDGASGNIQYCLGYCACAGNIVAGFVGTSGGWTTSPGFALVNGTWTHVVGVYDGSAATLSLYVNGELVGTTPGVDSSVASSGLTKRIGRRWDLGDYFNGSIDDVAFWNTHLTEDEIKLIYSRQSAKYSGTFTSRVMDNGSADAWQSLAWTTTLPFGKELPDRGSSESSANYSSLIDATTDPGTSHDLMDGVAGLWHLNEGSSSTTVNDTSGNANAGTVHGGVTLEVPGKLGSGAKFDGSSGYVSIPTSSSLEITGTITVSAWVYTRDNSVAYQSVLRKGGSPDYQLRLGNGSQKPQFVATIGGNYKYAPATTTLENKTWTHVVGTYDGSQVRIYINGMLEPPGGDCYATGAIKTDSSDLTIGAGDNWFPGMLDEVAIWNRALSDDEVLRLYRRGANRIKFQVRSCTSSDCSDRSSSGDWLGPDGSNQSYFSELHNNDAFSMSGDPIGAVLTGLPSLLFSNFTSLSVPSRQFFQYRAILESDDTSTACSGSWCSPELKSVTITP